VVSVSVEAQGAPDPLDPLGETRHQVATACRILARRGMMPGVLGHVSVRAVEGALLVRCRGPHESGVVHTTAEDIRLVDYDGHHLDAGAGWDRPKELPIHTRLLERRPDVNAVVHAHPPAALLCGLAGLPLRPVFGAYNIPAMRMAIEGVGVYPRPVLISRPDLADEMLEAMGDHRICLLRGHGITVAGASVEQATVAAVNFEELCRVTLELARLGAVPPTVTDADLAELPDLGGPFNDHLAWQALVAEL